MCILEGIVINGHLNSISVLKNINTTNPNYLDFNGQTNSGQVVQSAQAILIFMSIFMVAQAFQVYLAFDSVRQLHCSLLF